MKYIKEWEGIYSITETGDVFSHKNNIFLKKTTNKVNGYVYVTLKAKPRIETKSIHRLVAQSFIPNLKNKAEVDHINCLKTDNSVSNLRWATRKEQIKYSFDNNNRGDHLDKVSTKVINKKTGVVFNSQRELADALEINYSTMKWRIRHNKCDWELK